MNFVPIASRASLEGGQKDVSSLEGTKPLIKASLIVTIFVPYFSVYFMSFVDIDIKNPYLSVNVKPSRGKS